MYDQGADLGFVLVLGHVLEYPLPCCAAQPGEESRLTLTGPSPGSRQCQQAAPAKPQTGTSVISELTIRCRVMCVVPERSELILERKVVSELTTGWDRTLSDSRSTLVRPQPLYQSQDLLIACSAGMLIEDFQSTYIHIVGAILEQSMPVNSGPVRQVVLDVDDQAVTHIGSNQRARKAAIDGNHSAIYAIGSELYLGKSEVEFARCWWCVEIPCLDVEGIVIDIGSPFGHRQGSV
jgi:hypothetical protein